MIDGPINIAFEGVSFTYPRSQPLFTDLSLALRQGGFYLVQGPSGSGKSTLLRLINRLEEPTSGRIVFKSKPLSSYPPPRLRRSILYVQQTPTVIDASVQENLLLPFGFKNNKDLPRPDREKISELLNEYMLEGVGLEDNALSLSVGQMQRLCFIRGLLLSPEVLLLDEPTSALDDLSAQVVESAVDKCLTSGLTVLMITHREFKPETAWPIVLAVTRGQVVEKAWTAR